MSQELSRRCALLLWAAMAFALAAGLMAAPAFDPLGALYHHPGSAFIRLMPVLLAAGLHGLLCAGGAWWLMRSLRHRPAKQRQLGYLALALSCLGLLLWALSLHPQRTADARLLLWLQLLPLCWALAWQTARPTAVMPERAAAITAVSQAS